MKPEYVSTINPISHAVARSAGKNKLRRTSKNYILFLEMLIDWIKF